MTAVKPRRRGNGDAAAPRGSPKKPALEAARETARRARPMNLTTNLTMNPLLARRWKPSARPPFFFPMTKLICIALEAGQVRHLVVGHFVQHDGPGRATSRDVFGLAPGRLDGSKMILENEVHPDDWARRPPRPCRKPWRHAPCRGACNIGSRPRPARTSAGSRRSRPSWIEDGVPVKLLGLCRDVTDRAKKPSRSFRVRAKQQEAVARLGAQALTELGLAAIFR